MTAGRLEEWFPAAERLALLGERSLSMERRLAVDEGCDDEDMLDEEDEEEAA
jgi:hypothetical protein